MRGLRLTGKAGCGRYTASHAAPIGASRPGPAGRKRQMLLVRQRGERGRIRLPPLRRVEDYLELVAAVEETAAALRLPVIVEGIVKKNVQIKEISFTKPTLDQVFLEVTGKSMRDEDASESDSFLQNVMMERAR